MEHNRLRNGESAKTHIHWLVLPSNRAVAPLQPEPHDVARAVPLFARLRLWSLSRNSSHAVRPDCLVEKLVLSTAAGGPVARIVARSILGCLGVAAFAAAGEAQDSNSVDRRPHHAGFSATGLPPGVHINPATGIISGTVDRAAIVDGKMTYDARISFRDINGVSGHFTISIVLPNEKPVAEDDVATAKRDGETVIPVLDNDLDEDGDELLILWARSAQSNKVSTDGRTLAYTAVNPVLDEDVIAYAVSDGHGGEAIAQVRVSLPQ